MPDIVTVTGCLLLSTPVQVPCHWLGIDGGEFRAGRNQALRRCVA